MAEGHFNYILCATGPVSVRRALAEAALVERYVSIDGAPAVEVERSEHVPKLGEIRNSNVLRMKGDFLISGG